MATQSAFEEGSLNEGPSFSKRSKLETEDKTKPITEIDRIIFPISDFLKLGPTAKFGILQLGPLCNASKSCSFTEANCDVKTVTNENDTALIFDFNSLFSKGIELLRDLNGNERGLEEHDLAAINILNDFFKEKDQHEESLNQILRGHQSDGDQVILETDKTIAIAEHLLGKLSPGKSYIIDSRFKRKENCRCGFNHCKNDPAFGSTGIGHEEVWHGFSDIIFSSYSGIPESAASFVEDSESSATLSCPIDDGEDESEDDSPGNRTIAENQAIAQTIVLSHIQRKRHPNSSNFLIPNILISPLDFRIIMFDAVNDILICSVPLPIFQPYPSSSLQIASIIILWMVLHHRTFCVGINTSLIIETIGEMKKIQSHFEDRAREKLDLYVNALKFGVQSFPMVEVLPSLELLEFGVHLIPQTYDPRSAEL